MITGEYDAAAARAQEALAIAGALADEHLGAEALHVLALVTESQGNEQAHLELTAEGLDLAKVPKVHRTGRRDSSHVVQPPGPPRSEDLARGVIRSLLEGFLVASIVTRALS